MSSQQYIPLPSMDSPTSAKPATLGGLGGGSGGGSRSVFTRPWKGVRYSDAPKDDEGLGLLDSDVLGHDDEDFPASTLPGTRFTSGFTKSSASKLKSRTIPFFPTKKSPTYAPNRTTNTKYTVITFLPLVLYSQFRVFFNLYFLLVALSQFVPQLRIGFLSTYVLPLVFVMGVTMGKEALDDLKRARRDKEVNRESVGVVRREIGLARDEEAAEGDYTIDTRESATLKVGDFIHLEKDARIPADCVLLRTGDGEGCFVRTDQLDGETDWKLRIPLSGTQTACKSTAQVLKLDAELYADPPIKDIHTFVGTLTYTAPRDAASLSAPTMGRFTISSEDGEEPAERGEDGAIVNRVIEPVTASNVLWANTVLASGSALAMVVYTGKDTRAVLNTSHPKTKWGALEAEVNSLAKILFVSTLALSVLLVALSGFGPQWYVYVFRFLILFSSIVPISLRVNLDMGKTVYANQIQSDKDIPGALVRTSTLPEELGRIEYLLSDKTGTLTRNEMELKKLHMGSLSFSGEAMEEVGRLLSSAMGPDGSKASGTTSGQVQHLAMRGRRDIEARVKEVVLALALCHNVTPTEDEGGYQASSPDEIAIVRWCESVGLRLVGRDRNTITLLSPMHERLTWKVLDMFPFTSESKRMGIVVQGPTTPLTDEGDIYFYQKGADVVMAPIVQKNDWLEEECGNMAREGLRTLVVARKSLTPAEYTSFKSAYHAASISTEGRAEGMTAVIGEHLEKDMELLGVTGVEDKLQDDVKSTIELLRNAGVKIWMLTGDKVETAQCIAVSTKLVARNQFVCTVQKLTKANEMRDKLDFLQSKPDCCLVIDGESLQLALNLFHYEFIEIATKLSAVVACRCSPTQKAEVAKLIRKHTKKRVCCIGDGGNDVSMIQAADVGVGIVGKEGKQASLAADFSILQFSHLTKLLLWHGRNSYKRSAKLAQFVIHRGLIISVMQAVFSAIFYFAPIALYQGWLMVGYATVYTMAPVFSLVLDRDVTEDLALLYPELYKELTKGRSLSYKTFFEWTIISLYQGAAIMIMSLVLFENEFLNIVAISFSALVLNELIMVALQITIWHRYMIIAEVVTLFFYVISMWFLPEYFDLSFVLSTRFAWKVAVIVAVSSLPLYFTKVIRGFVSPAATSKLT